MARRETFDVGEILDVAANMDAFTHDYVIKAKRAAQRRARRKDWPEEARRHMKRAAETMSHALKTWPKGHFDMRICELEAKDNG